MDMQIRGLPGNTTPSLAALDEALTYLNHVNTALANRVIAALSPYIDHLSVTKYLLLSSQEHDGLSATLDDLIALFERQRIEFITNSAREPCVH